MITDPLHEHGHGPDGALAHDAVPEDRSGADDGPSPMPWLRAALDTLVRRSGSDLHLAAGIPPRIRVHGELVALEEFGIQHVDQLGAGIRSLLTPSQRELLETRHDLDCSFGIDGLARFRMACFRQRGALGAVIRLVPLAVRSLDELGVPPAVADLADLHRGLVLVTGPTGSGKSTTLAALIDRVNRTRAAHIVTIEDPIEFLHRHDRSIVNQREVGADTRDFATALRHALRQDPDVILIGELRDLETVQTAVTAAETGHLVFATLHTRDVPQTVERLIDVFPPDQQEQIRMMLAASIAGVVCQQLVPTADRDGRVVACEVMTATSAIRNVVREGKTHQMRSLIQSGRSHGMVTFDHSLAELVRDQTVTLDVARELAHDRDEFDRLVRR